MRGPAAMTVQKCEQFPRQHLMDRHDSICALVAEALRSAGCAVVLTGAEHGGRRYDPDLFVQQRPGQFGFYLEIKRPDGPNIAIDLDPWLHFRVLRDVFVLGVWMGGRFALVDIDRDRPLFWGAAADDRIPVLAADQLRMLDVPLQLFERGDPRRTSNKPFIIYRPRRVYPSLEQALSVVLRKAGVSR
jgi:hypothetical protein